MSRELSTEANQQKMREALEKVNEIYDILSKPCIVAEEARQACREARGVLIPALSKPPRNCDRFNTGDVKQDAQDAMEAILDEGVAGYRGIAEYLLSPVRTERKGEGNGIK